MSDTKEHRTVSEILVSMLRHKEDAERSCQMHHEAAAELIEALKAQQFDDNQECVVQIYTPVDGKFSFSPVIVKYSGCLVSTRTIREVK